jgi:hypothetical protein
VRLERRPWVERAGDLRRDLELDLDRVVHAGVLGQRDDRRPRHAGRVVNEQRHAGRPHVRGLRRQVEDRIHGRHPTTRGCDARAIAGSAVASGSTEDYDRVVDLPDARDGLTRKERLVLTTLAKLQAERGDRMVPLPMLYGRVLEHADMSIAELQEIVARLGARRP